jgi:hypothetical protein
MEAEKRGAGVEVRLESGLDTGAAPGLASGLAIEAPNRRRVPRQAVDEDASILILNLGTRVACRVIDLSLGGCRLRTAERFMAGPMVRVEVTFRVLGLIFRFSGVTQWTDGRKLVGVRFVDVTSRRRGELAEALGEVEAENAAKARERAEKEEAARRLAAESQTAAGQNGGAGQIHLVPRASDQPGQAAATGAESQPDAAGPAAPDKQERRSQARHEVDTRAVIFLINIGCRVVGRIVDLSLNGCRIRTDERFPVGIYTRVEIEFHLEGLPFRLGGVIQAIHDRHHVGIRFLDLSDRKRGQVEQLIGEIEDLEKKQKAAAEEQVSEPAGQQVGKPAS